MEKRSLEVALYRPLIPQNTGNIGRLCVGFNSSLSIIGEPGFSIDDKHLKRAGLDYWQYLDFNQYENFEEYYKLNKERDIVCLSKFGDCMYDLHDFKIDSIILAGRETTGVPDELTEKYNIKRVAIPVYGNVRSYNLANSVAIVISEAERQLRGRGIFVDSKKF